MREHFVRDWRGVLLEQDLIYRYRGSALLVRTVLLPQPIHCEPDLR